MTVQPTVEDLAQRDSTFESLQSEAETSIDNSASDDLSSEVQDDQEEESEVEEAFKKCLIAAMAAAAEAAERGEDIPTAFLAAAESCLLDELSGLSPTTEAIKLAADYLQADVGPPVSGQQAPATTTTTTSQPTPDPSSSSGGSSSSGSGGSSFPWWGWVLVAAGVIGIGRVLTSK